MNISHYDKHLQHWKESSYSIDFFIHCLYVKFQIFSTILIDEIVVIAFSLQIEKKYLSFYQVRWPCIFIEHDTLPLEYHLATCIEDDMIKRIMSIQACVLEILKEFLSELFHIPFMNFFEIFCNSFLNILK